jgi:hypothetical protein
VYDIRHPQSLYRFLSSYRYRCEKDALPRKLTHETRTRSRCCRNAQKAAQARAKNAAKAADEGKGGGGAKGLADRTTFKDAVKCKICLAVLPAGQAKIQYEGHVDSKVSCVHCEQLLFLLHFTRSQYALQHPKETLASCFGADLVYK